MLPTNRVRVHLSLRWPSHSPCILCATPPQPLQSVNRRPGAALPTAANHGVCF